MREYDHRAAKQIFGVREYSRGEKCDTLTTDRVSNNPIDIVLRSISILPSFTTNIHELFMEKWIAAKRPDGQGIVVGRIKDIYPDRTIRMKTKSGDDAIVPFENVLELRASEI